MKNFAKQNNFQSVIIDTFNGRDIKLTLFFAGFDAN